MPVQILVADDSVTMRRIMELTFAGEDAEVTTVATGSACVEEAKRAQPAVVFADCSMGDMDGYAVAQAIKTTDGLEQTAVIVMASQKLPYDEAKGKAAGVDDHIVKPFDTQHVIDRVNQVLGRPRAGAEEAAQASAVPAAPSFAPAPVAEADVASMPAPAAPPVPMPGTIPPEAPPPALDPAPAPAAAAGVGGVAATVTAHNSELAGRLQSLGLNSEQLEGVLALSREVVEQVVWEVVPDLAERMIKEEIQRLTSA